MSDDDNSDVKQSLLDRLLEKQIPWRDALNLAYIPGVIQQQRDLHHSGKRMEAQVDALLRSKYGQCEEDVYQPPEDDDMGDTYINCPIVGDAAISRIASAEQRLPASQQPVRQRKPWWWNPLKALLLLAAVTLGAALVWWTLQNFAGGDSYEIVAQPYVPSS